MPTVPVSASGWTRGNSALRGVRQWALAKLLAQRNDGSRQRLRPDLWSGPGVSTFVGSVEAFFVALDKGDAALFAAGGLEFTAEDPLWSPFSSLSFPAGF